MLPFPLPLLLSFLLPSPPPFSLPTWVYCVGQTDFELPSLPVSASGLPGIERAGHHAREFLIGLLVSLGWLEKLQRSPVNWDSE